MRLFGYLQKKGNKIGNYLSLAPQESLREETTKEPANIACACYASVVDNGRVGT